MWGILFILLTPVVFDENIKKLDSDDCTTRKTAQKELTKFVLNEFYVDKIKHHAEKGSPEVKMRCRRILEDYYYVMPTKYNKMPWINLQDLTIEEEYNKFSPRPSIISPEYETYRIATREYVRYKMVEKGWTRKQAIIYLDKLVEKELEFRKTNKNLYPNEEP